MELVDRRTALQILAVAGLVIASGYGCKRSRFQRPPGLHDLGEVTSLLYPKQHVADKEMLVVRDDKGWACLSMRCSYDGCDLTFQDKDLFCSCCNSHFAHIGTVLHGPAKDPLPWFQLEYRDGHLYADSGKIVQASYRFTSPEAEQVIDDYRNSPAGQAEQTHPVPKILMGEGDQDDQINNDLPELPDTSISDMTDTKRNTGNSWR